MQIVNKKAKFDYLFLEKIEAGIALTGDDIKNIRDGKANLGGAYAKIINGEVFLVSQNFPTRKLLLHKNEIIALEAKIKAKKLILVPIKLYNKHRLVKVQLALAKPKKTFEKRAIIKKRELDRDLKAGF